MTDNINTGTAPPRIQFFDELVIYTGTKVDGAKVYYVPFIDREQGRVGYVVRTNPEPPRTCPACGESGLDDADGLGETYRCPNGHEAAAEDTVKGLPNDQLETYVYFNPSDGDGDSPHVFVYMGGDNDPANDTPQHYYEIEF